MPALNQQLEHVSNVTRVTQCDSARVGRRFDSAHRYHHETWRFLFEKQLKKTGVSFHHGTMRLVKLVLIFTRALRSEAVDSRSVLGGMSRSRLTT